MKGIMKERFSSRAYVEKALKAAAVTVSYGWPGSMSKDIIAAQHDFIGKVAQIFDAVVPAAGGLDILAYSDKTGAYIEVNVIGEDIHWYFNANELIPEDMRLFAEPAVNEPAGLTEAEIEAIQRSVKNDAIMYLTGNAEAAEIQAGYTSRCNLVIIIKPIEDYAYNRRRMMMAVEAAIRAAKDPKSHWNPHEIYNPYTNFPCIAYAGMNCVVKSKDDNELFIEMCSRLGKNLKVWIENNYPEYGGLIGRAYDAQVGYTYSAHEG